MVFLPVSHCWTLQLYFLTCSTLSCACGCSLKTLGACNCCVVGLYFSDLQLMYNSSMFENICIDRQTDRQTDRQNYFIVMYMHTHQLTYNKMLCIVHLVWHLAVFVKKHFQLTDADA